MGRLGLIVNCLRMPSLNTNKKDMIGIGEEPLYALTVEQFTQLLDDRIAAALGTNNKVISVNKPSGNYVYGLRGIQQLFGVSHKTAQEYKDTFLRPAVMQNGRKIVVDADLAMELFNKKKTL